MTRKLQAAAVLAALPADRRVLAGTMPGGPGRGGQALPASGLIGPVRIISVTRGEGK